MYVVAGLEPQTPRAGILADLRRRLPHLSVFERDEFSDRTRRYWMFETGMGIGFLLTAALAVSVGTVIVSQNVYSTTTEHVGEYGTLKAMGMPTRRLAGVVVAQGLIAGIAGALPGALLGAGVVGIIRGHGLAAVFTPGLALLTVSVALATCAVAALASVRRVAQLEPALVFRT